MPGKKEKYKAPAAAPEASAKASSATAGGILGKTVVATGQVPGETAEQPWAAYGFIDFNKWGAYALVFLFLAAIVMTVLEKSEIPPTMIVCLVVALPMLLMSRRIKSMHVLELYEDYLVFRTSEYKKPVAVNYGDIARVKMLRGFARLTVRYAEGFELSKGHDIMFIRIPGKQRAEARQKFTDKMRELGVPVV